MNPSKLRRKNLGSKIFFFVALLSCSTALWSETSHAGNHKLKEVGVVLKYLFWWPAVKPNSHEEHRLNGYKLIKKGLSGKMNPHEDRKPYFGHDHRAFFHNSAEIFTLILKEGKSSLDVHKDPGQFLANYYRGLRGKTCIKIAGHPSSARQCRIIKEIHSSGLHPEILSNLILEVAASKYPNKSDLSEEKKDYCLKRFKTLFAKTPPFDSWKDEPPFFVLSEKDEPLPPGSILNAFYDLEEKFPRLFGKK